MQKTAYLFFVGGLFFIFDQALKYLSRAIWVEKKLISNFFGWFPFKNTGAAFGIPLPPAAIILPSLVILFLLIYLLWRGHNPSLRQFGMILIISGAASNLIDRILLGYTVDYFLILTGIINFADIMIVVGFGLYLLTYKGGNYVSKT